MPDVVTAKIFCNTTSRLGVHLTGVSDGSGEAAVIKVDKSTLTATDGIEPNSLDVEAIRWNVSGWAGIRLMWDHTADEDIAVLSGSGSDEWVVRGGNEYSSPYGLQDGRGAGGTGDILLTTLGTPTANYTYDITLWLRKRDS